MDLQHIIAQKKELLVRETFSRQTINYSENMAADEKDRFIQYLVDKVNTYELNKRAKARKLGHSCRMPERTNV